jgi:hypothetical protein
VEAVCAGVRLGVACYAVLLLGVYQLLSSGLLGGVPSARMHPALRGGVLLGLALLLAPLLLLWLGSGPLLIRQRRAAAPHEEQEQGLVHEGRGEPHPWVDGGVTVQLRTEVAARKGAEDAQEPLLAAVQARYASCQPCIVVRALQCHVEAPPSLCALCGRSRLRAQPGKQRRRRRRIGC